MTTQSASLSLTGGTLLPAVGPYRPFILETTAGNIETRLYATSASTSAVIWLGDAVGGFDSPAAGLYDRLAERLIERGVASLRVQYRNPTEEASSGLDALAAAMMLAGQGFTRLVMVGHGMGALGAVQTALAFPQVAAVALLAPAPYAAEGVEGLSPRPLLVLHGVKDHAVPTGASRALLDRAREPKQILYYQQAGHSLVEAVEHVTEDLSRWLDEQLPT